MKSLANSAISEAGNYSHSNINDRAKLLIYRGFFKSWFSATIRNTMMKALQTPTALCTVSPM
jgi:hypothetical protein